MFGDGEGLFFGTSQEYADDGAEQGEGSEAHEEPFEGMECDADDGGFGVGVIPVQVGAVGDEQGGEGGEDGEAGQEEEPMEGITSSYFFTSELKIYDFEFFGESGEWIGFRLGDCFAEQGRDGGIEGVGEGDEQIGIRDRETLFPF